MRLALEAGVLSDLAGGTVNKERDSTQKPSFVWKTVAPSMMSFSNKGPSGSRMKSWLKQLLSKKGWKYSRIEGAACSFGAKDNKSKRIL